jgi:hypothetical protein
MSEPIEAVYVAVLCTVWFFGLFGLSYRFGPLLAKQNPPIALPLVVFVWTMITLPGLVVWVQNKAVVGQVKTTTSWFVVGWTHKLNFFNIIIESWWEYTLLLMYNIGRTVLGSLVSNVFRPLLMLQQSRLLTSEISQKDASVFVFGQGVITVFGYLSAITDIFLALTQVDVTMVAVGVTLLMDGFATHGILSSRIRQNKAVGSRDDSRGVSRGRAPPATASAAAWRRTLPPMLPPTRKAGLGETPYSRRPGDGYFAFDLT